MPSEANKARGRLDKRISSRSVGFKNAVAFSNSFNVMRTLCFPSHTSLHMHDRPAQKHVPRLLTNPHVLVQRSLRCAREAHAFGLANTYT